MKIKICAASELSENKSIKFIIPGNKFDRDGFVIHKDGKLHAYYNECPHIGIALDWNDNDFFSLDLKSLVCKNHGAEFVPQSGKCTAGPCVGANLKPIDVMIENNEVFAITVDS